MKNILLSPLTRPLNFNSKDHTLSSSHKIITLNLDDSLVFETTVERVVEFTRVIVCVRECVCVCIEVADTKTRKRVTILS